MALQCNITFRGIVIENAISKIYSYRGGKEGSGLFTFEFAVAHYAKDGEEAFTTSDYSCLIDLNAGNPIEQAYNHLKTLPKFADAVDYQP